MKYSLKYKTKLQKRMTYFPNDIQLIITVKYLLLLREINNKQNKKNYKNINKSSGKK